MAAPPRDLLQEWLEQWSEVERERYTQENESKCKAFWDTVNSSPVFTYLSWWEREFATTTILTMSSQQQIDALWHLESAQVLIWALSLMPELPVPDAQADADILKLEILSRPTGLLSSAQLRPKAEIEHARNVAELWHWRSRTEDLIREGRPFPSGDEVLRNQGLTSYQDIVRMAANAAHERGDLLVVSEGDFAVKGRPFARLSLEEWSEVRSISVERHRALNWLCGYSPNNDWDTTPTDS